MKTEELVAALRKCGSVGAGCDGCPFENGGAIDAVWCGDAFVLAAADRLEEYVDRCKRYAAEIMVLREQQSNDPLSLDELRQMDGEPVWVVRLDGRLKSRWHIVGSSLWIEMFTEWDGAFSLDYGKTWLAYRHKTEGVNNGKDG